jgi:parallel beta-helix repeat protein
LSYIDFGDDPDFDITGDITISLWFKTNTSQLGVFVSKLDIHNPDNGYDLAMGNVFGDPDPGGTIYFRVAKDSYGLAQYDVAQTNSTFTDDSWHLLTAVYTPDGLSRPKLYIDAVEQSVSYYGQPLSSIGASPGYHFKIAEYSPESGYFNFNGTLDEARIYNRALTDREIYAHYYEVIPPNIVYVDDDYNETVFGWNITHFTEIQQGIDAVEENGIVYVFNGTYYENLVIGKTIDLIGEDRNTTVIDGGGSGIGVNIRSHHITISGFTVKNCNEAIFLETHIYNYYTIKDNILLNNEYGIYAYFTDSNNISNNIFIDNRIGIAFPYSNDDNVLSNNIIKGGGETGLWIEDGESNLIFNNQIFNQSGCGIQFSQDSKYNIVSNNTISSNSYGMFLDFSNDNTILNNTISLNNQHGIYILNSELNDVVNNTFVNNNIQGVRIELSSNNIICDNKVEENLDDGINLCYSAHNNTISGNVICTNSDDGIQLYDQCNDNEITSNLIIDNGDEGILIHDSSESTIVGNIIEGNDDFGIQIRDSSNDNRLYHNNFNNTFNAIDGCSNIWDNEYPSGGNYWSDYEGNDTNNDGIGDIPYSLYGVYDRYPLMYPWNGTEPTPNYGDANADGVINLGDVVYLINYLFRGGSPPIPAECVGDCNGDCIVDLGDVVYLINYLFRGGPEPSGCCG